MSAIDKLFETLQIQLNPYRKMLGQAADTILNENVSQYPIFVVHQQEVEIGLVITERAESEGLLWSVHASTLEEFVGRNIIQEEKVPAFIRAFKDPESFVCLFVLSELGANFIFLPRVDAES